MQSTKLRPLLVVGTRPEAIKMAPVVQECRRRSSDIEPIVCTTGQHREMVDPILDWFGIEADERLDVMTPNQSLAEVTSRCVEGLDRCLVARRPDCVVVQGDTTTVMAASLSAFYRRVPVVHVEAGLRTGNLLSPWPEELNRRIADMIAEFNCAPTQGAANALLAEGVPAERIRVTGNTVVDALLETSRCQQAEGVVSMGRYDLPRNARVVLITGHRRESFGPGLQNICRAIRVLAERFRDCHFVYPVHLNPNVQGPVYGLLGGLANVHLLAPVPYPEFVWLMGRSTIILTDSGGIQEEAPSLGKPVLVMRETTERPEAVEAGAAKLVGTSEHVIVTETSRLLDDPQAYAACQIGRNPYGDGHAATRIVDWMLEGLRR